MTKDEALKLALDALRSTSTLNAEQHLKKRAAVIAIKEALAAPVQEPVALEPTIKLALTHIEGIKQDPHSSLTQSRARLAIAVLERITTPPAAPTVQEESHWIDDENRIKWLLWRVKDLEKRLQDTNPLAAQRQWVGLTSQDWNVIGFTSEFRAGAEWANDKLKEKNA